MLDMIIKGGSIVDGTGAAPVPGDVGIRDGRIVAVSAQVDEPAAEMVDAERLGGLPWVRRSRTPTTTHKSSGTRTQPRRTSSV